jgi:hypothetical protein
MELSIENIRDKILDPTGESKKVAGFFGKERKWHIHRIGIMSLWVMFIIAAFILVIRTSHFVIPESWRWLDSENLQNIDKFLFSGAFGGILVKYAGYLFKSNE